MLDYKDIITEHYALGMSGAKIAESLKVSKSGVNDFLRAFKACPTLDYPLPEGITNYGIASAVYRNSAALVERDLSYEMPDYETVEKDMTSRKNMTLTVLWNRYAKRCRDSGLKFYSYRQFCENYAKWCEKNKESLHFNAVIGQKMEVDFAGKTFTWWTISPARSWRSSYSWLFFRIPSTFTQREWSLPGSRNGSLSTTMP